MCSVIVHESPFICSASGAVFWRVNNKNKNTPGNKTSQAFFYTYVLQSLKDGDHYIGYTNNLRKRLEEHLKGRSFATRLRRPFKLIYFEACLNEQDAKQREKYLKTTNGRRFLIKRLRRFRALNVWHLR